MNYTSLQKEHLYSNNFEIYTINLKESTQRLDYITQQFKNADLRFNRFEAVNGNKIDIPELYKTGIVSAKWLKNGQIGVAMSHIKLWKHIKATCPTDYAIIFEDDVKIPKDFRKKIINIQKELPSDWDMLFLGGTSVVGHKYSDNLVVAPTKCKTKNQYSTGMFAYMINKKCIDKLLEYATPLITAIDNQIKDKAIGELKVFSSNPAIVTHNYELFSDNNRISGLYNYRKELTDTYLKKARSIFILDENCKLINTQ